MSLLTFRRLLIEAGIALFVLCGSTVHGVLADSTSPATPKPLDLPHRQARILIGGLAPLIQPIRVGGGIQVQETLRSVPWRLPC